MARSGLVGSDDGAGPSTGCGGSGRATGLDPRSQSIRRIWRHDGAPGSSTSARTGRGVRGTARRSNMTEPNDIVFIEPVETEPVEARKPAPSGSGGPGRPSGPVRIGIVAGTALLVVLGAAVAMGASPAPSTASGASTVPGATAAPGTTDLDNDGNKGFDDARRRHARRRRRLPRHHDRLHQRLEPVAQDGRRLDPDDHPDVQPRPSPRPAPPSPSRTSRSVTRSPSARPSRPTGRTRSTRSA